MGLKPMGRCPAMSDQVPTANTHHLLLSGALRSLVTVTFVVVLADIGNGPIMQFEKYERRSEPSFKSKHDSASAPGKTRSESSGNAPVFFYFSFRVSVFTASTFFLTQILLP